MRYAGGWAWYRSGRWSSGTGPRHTYSRVMRDLAPSILRQRLLICRAFDPAVAVETTRWFFAMTAIESQSF